MSKKFKISLGEQYYKNPFEQSVIEAKEMDEVGGGWKRYQNDTPVVRRLAFQMPRSEFRERYGRSYRQAGQTLTDQQQNRLTDGIYGRGRYYRRKPYSCYRRVYRKRRYRRRCC